MDPLITKETDERFTDCWVNRGIKISADDMADHYPPLADNSFSREDVRQSLAAIAPMIENLRKALSV